MRARTALRVVALLSTLAGPAALPPSAAAATTTTSSKTKKPSSKSSKKSTPKSSTASKSTASKSTASKSSKSKSTASSSKSSTATASSGKASTSTKSSAGKAAYDPVATSTSIPGALPAASASAAGAPQQRGPTRIDFDDRLIQGQTNKSGSVYLYDRKELKQSSMVKKRESFREEIVGVVYDSEL